MVYNRAVTYERMVARQTVVYGIFLGFFLRWESSRIPHLADALDRKRCQRERQVSRAGLPAGATQLPVRTCGMAGFQAGNYDTGETQI